MLGIKRKGAAEQIPYNFSRLKISRFRESVHKSRKYLCQIKMFIPNKLYRHAYWCFTCVSVGRESGGC